MGILERTKTIKSGGGNYSIGKVNLLNKRVGSWKFYNHMNVLKIKETFSDDHSFGEQRKGPFEHYYDTSFIKMKGFYETEEYSNFVLGTCFYYYKTGQLHSMCVYKKRHRSQSELLQMYKRSDWMRGRGSTSFNREYSTTSGIEGPLVQFHKDGSIMLETYVSYIEVYENERYHSFIMSPFCIYDQNGTVLKKSVCYSSGPYGLEIGINSEDYSIFEVVDKLLDKDFNFLNKDFTKEDEEHLQSIQKECKQLGDY
jgi:hypothetical protein